MVEETPVQERTVEDRKITIHYILHTTWKDTVAPKVVTKTFENFPYTDNMGNFVFEFRKLADANIPEGFEPRHEMDFYNIYQLKNGEYEYGVYAKGYEFADVKMVNLKHIDVNTGESVFDGRTLGVTEEKTYLTYFDLFSSPHGYNVIYQDSYPIKTEMDENGTEQFYAVIPVEKGPVKDISFKFMEFVDGGYQEVGCVRTPTADLNPVENKVNIHALDFLVPDGYRISSFYSDTETIDVSIMNRTIAQMGIGVSLEPMRIRVEKVPVVSYPVVNDTNIAGLEITPEVQTILNESLSNDKELMKKIQDSGKEVSFHITSSKDVNKEEVKQVSDFASKKGYVGVEAFDVTIEVVDEDGVVLGTLNETTKPLTFTYTIPKTLKKEGRQFSIIRYHNGEFNIQPMGEGQFTSNQFSTYYVVYKDAVVTDNNKHEEKEEKTEPSNKKENVTTSTETNATLFMVLMAVALVAIAALVFYNKNKKK